MTDLEPLRKVIEGRIMSFQGITCVMSTTLLKLESHPVCLLYIKISPRTIPLIAERSGIRRKFSLANTASLLFTSQGKRPIGLSILTSNTAARLMIDPRDIMIESTIEATNGKIEIITEAMNETIEIIIEAPNGEIEIIIEATNGKIEIIIEATSERIGIIE